MEKLGFSLMQLIVESTTEGERFIMPSKEIFESLTTTSLQDKEVYYSISVEKTDDYLWLYFNHGKATPRTETVINIETGIEKDNLRLDSEAELLDQLFVLYYYETHTLYVSNAKKVKVIETFFKKNLQQDICIKHFYKSPQELIAILKTIESIKFTSVANIFNQDDKKRQALKDLTGTDAPETFTLVATYKQKTISKWLHTLIGEEDNYSICDLVVCGRDENEANVTATFNKEMFVRKIEIHAAREQTTGLFTPDSIKCALLNILSNER